MAGAQTSPDLDFLLTAANWPILQGSNKEEEIPVSLSMMTTPAGSRAIRGMVPQPHKCPPLTIITVTVIGWAAGSPAWVSLSLQGRTGFLRVG